MALKNRIHVHSMKSLQMEKQRLEALCELKETKLKLHYSEFKNNYGKIAFNSLLPFEDDTRSKISSVLDLLNENVLPSLLGFRYKKGTGDLSKNFLKVAQAVVISMSFQLFRKWLGKHHKQPAN